MSLSVAMRSSSPYPHDGIERALAPSGQTCPACFESLPLALMTSRRRRKSITGEYVAGIEGPNPASAKSRPVWRR